MIRVSEPVSGADYSVIWECAKIPAARELGGENGGLMVMTDLFGQIAYSRTIWTQAGRRTRTAVAVGGLVLLAACATTTPPAPQVAASAPVRNSEEFRVSDFAWSQTPGKGRIDGRVTYRAGDLAYGCAGAGVVLTPETPWTRRRMTILYKSPKSAALPAGEVRGRTPPGSSNDFAAYVKRATCDASGKFAFNGLADGAWYLITVAKAPGTSNDRDMAIMRRVEIRGGKAIEVAL